MGNKKDFDEYVDRVARTLNHDRKEVLHAMKHDVPSKPPKPPKKLVKKSKKSAKKGKK